MDLSSFEFYLYEKGTSSTKSLCYYAAVVCTSFIFSHLFLGSRISSLVTEIYNHCKTRAWPYCKVFNKEYNIAILLSKWGQNVTQKLFDNQTPVLTKREREFSSNFVISAESIWTVFYGTYCYMIMLLYDMKFRITLFDMIKPSPCVLFFPMNFLVSNQKTEANFQILQLNPYFD